MHGHGSLLFSGGVDLIIHHQEPNRQREVSESDKHDFACRLGVQNECRKKIEPVSYLNCYSVMVQSETCVTQLKKKLHVTSEKTNRKHVVQTPFDATDALFQKKEISLTSKDPQRATEHQKKSKHRWKRGQLCRGEKDDAEGWN